MKTVRVLLVDDHAILRMGLASLLSSKADIEVVGDAPNGPAGIRKALRLKPDVVIMDLMMPGMDGIEATRELLAKAPSSRVLILTTFGTSDGISQAIDVGAMGAVMKNCDFRELAEAIRTVAAGGRYVAADVERIISADPPAAALSPRQTEILQSIVRGLSNPDIARQLGISVDVVKEHVESIFQKIGAANRTEAVAIAFRKHLLKLSSPQQLRRRRISGSFSFGRLSHDKFDRAQQPCRAKVLVGEDVAPGAESEAVYRARRVLQDFVRNAHDRAPVRDFEKIAQLSATSEIAFITKVSGL